MRLMRPDAKTTEHQHFQAEQAFDRCGRNFAKICRVSKVIETIRHHRQASVNDFKRGYFKILAQTKRGAVDDRVGHNLRQAAAKVRGLENILKDSPDVLPGAFVGVDAQRSMSKIQRANVIESENMIGVTMGNEDRI